MNRVSIWCKKRAAAASGAPDCTENADKFAVRAIFKANDSKCEKKR
jgi:hypothetical protein